MESNLKGPKIPSKNVTANLSGTGPNLPLLENYIGLDPHYNDIYGDPASRSNM